MQSSRSFVVSSGRSAAVAAHIVDKNNTVPPKASNPPPRKEPVPAVKATPVVVKPQQQQPKKTNLHQLPTSGWVIVRNIPPLSTLTDILQSINEVVDAQLDGGIVDLDAVWKGGGQVSMFERGASEEWVRSAHIVLSSHGRPNAWRIEFCNRSVAHAFLEYTRQNEFHCAWKPVTVERWEERDDNTDALAVSDSMIRVENTGDDVTIDNVRHLFRRYDMTREGPSVRVFNKDSPHKLFLVHFADASWARAAIRELQGVRVNNNFLRLAQYPRQLDSLEM